MTRYIIYIDPSTPCECYTSSARADVRRRELLDRGKMVRLFAVQTETRLWREWVAPAGRGHWYDVARNNVPPRVMEAGQF